VVTLNWTPPASNGGSAITAYRVYRGTASGGETWIATVGVVTTFTDTGLTNGTTYWYQVSAVNAVGEGTRSTETSARPATVPTAPRNVNATKNPTHGVTLTWLAPASNGGAAVTGYRIYRSTTSGSQTVIDVGNVLRYVDTDTTSGVRYYYQVSAVNDVGEGPRSTQTSAIAR
jgi:predicted phage tail protein